MLVLGSAVVMLVLLVVIDVPPVFVSMKPLSVEATLPGVLVVGVAAAGANLMFGKNRGKPLPPMGEMIKHSVFALIGAVLGGGLGILATMLLVWISVTIAPNDASAQSVGIVGIALVPAGLGLGAFRAYRWSTTKTQDENANIPPILK